MLSGGSRSTLLFVLSVLLSIVLFPSHSFCLGTHPVYQRQLSVITQFTLTTATFTDTTTISLQSEQPFQRSATSTLSTSFQSPPPSSFALSTSPSLLFSVRFSSSTVHQKESISLTSHQTSLVTPKTIASFSLPPIPVSTPRTTASLSVSDNKVTSILPVITSLASSNQDVPLPSFSAASAGATNSGFWSNKGAVGGTFAAVGVVVFGVCAIFLVTCLRKRRNRKPGEDSSSDFLDQGDPNDWPTQAGASGLNHQPTDPFAAGILIRRDSTGDNEMRSDNYISSHLSRTNYPNSATYSASRTSHNQPTSASSHRLGSPISLHQNGLLNVPPTHELAAPASPIFMASLLPIPSSHLETAHVSGRGHHSDSGASFYASQMHSRYYGENAESPSSATSLGKAF